MTLIEVMIALFIFAIISVIAITSLRSVLLQQEAIQARQQSLQQLSRAQLQIQEDVEQAINRPIRLSNGTLVGAFVAENTQRFELTHFQTNVTQEPRAQLQRVRYVWSKGQLLRITWPNLDQVSPQKENIRVLLEDAQQLQMTYIDAQGHAVPTWNSLAQDTMPSAVKIQWLATTGGALEWWFLLGNGRNPFLQGE